MLKDNLIKFISGLKKEENIDIDSKSELLDSGIIDSLNIMNLILFLEEETGSKISFDEIDLSDFSTVDSLYEKFSK
ncbi:acyl carrier protein [Providencia rettgeri]|uniref:acyl carrier protein n=1 Tax=Providencia rettgeri TaxID=587 RepID=UPI0032DB6696